jgi:histone deacetylase 1/2
MDPLIAALSSDFAIKDLGQLHIFLGIEVTQSSNGLALPLQKYSQELLRRAGMLECKSATTPMFVTYRMYAIDGTLLSSDDATSYRSIVPSVSYHYSTRYFFCS